MPVQFLPPRPILSFEFLVSSFELQNATNSKPETQNSKLPLRDGATGSTSGFEPEDEGSNPSPQPNQLSISNRQFPTGNLQRKRCFDSAQSEPFARFVSTLD
jgi:hypothetical protein